MNPDDNKKPLRRTIRGGRAFFFSDPAIDKVLNMVVTLGSEVWALRERLAALEAIQVGRGQLAGDEVDGYEFTPEQEARLASDRKEFIDNLFRILQEQVETAAAKAAGLAAGEAADVPAAKPASGARKLPFGARGAKPAKPPAASAVRKPAGRPATRPRPAARARPSKRRATRR